MMLSHIIWTLNFALVHSFRVTQLPQVLYTTRERQTLTPHHLRHGRHCTRQKSTFQLSSAQASTILEKPGAGEELEVDIVVIGSGFGGLSCAGLCAKYGYTVALCESHTELGGVAHTFKIDGYEFDSGPSLYSGVSTRDSPNPLRHVLNAIGEDCEWTNYDTWGTFVPKPNKQPDADSSDKDKTTDEKYGYFAVKLGPGEFYDVLDTYGGPIARSEWDRLMAYVEPLSYAAMVLPPAILRPDWSGFIPLFLKYPHIIPPLLRYGPALNRPFNLVLDEVGVKDKFIRSWLDLLCFVLQALPAEGTMTAVIAYMLADWYKPEVQLDYPRGGGDALMAALARGVTKYGPNRGAIFTNTHVEAIEIDSDNRRATGVRLRRGGRIKAKRAVVSGASLWDTARLLQKEGEGEGEDKGNSDGPKNTLKNPNSAADSLTGGGGGIGGGGPGGYKTPPPSLRTLSPFLYERVQQTAQCGTFLHLHLGFDGADLDLSDTVKAVDGNNLRIHYLMVKDWDKDIDATGNVVILSIPTVQDPSLSPGPNKHVLHCYLAASEPWEVWEGVQYKSIEYEALKKERAGMLYEMIEAVIPDIRQRVEVELIGTPRTHGRFNRRDRGTYGPYVRAGKDKVLPWGTESDVANLLYCGDSTFPGIGVPSSAASGTIVANSLASVQEHLQMIDDMGL